MPEWELPRNLLDAARDEDAGTGRRAWTAALPAVVDALAVRWSLDVGQPFQPGGATAWVAPARGAGGERVVLKVAWRHDEALHEADGLRAWDGRGAVRLLDAATLEGTDALLLETCEPGTPLSDAPEDEQDLVLASLLPDLWITPPPGHPFRPLQAMCDAWADACEARSAAAPSAAGLDPALAREGIALLRELPRSAPRHVLLATDLHAGNVLAATRAPWLAIDPSPTSATRPTTSRSTR